MLRGSLLLRTYCPRSPRLPEDLDFLALDENEPSLAEQRVRDVCSVAANDGVEFDVKAIQVTIAATTLKPLAEPEAAENKCRPWCNSILHHPFSSPNS